MRVIGIVGSPREGGNTEILVAEALKVCKEEELDTELIKLRGKEIKPCEACLICRTNKDCKVEDDFRPIFSSFFSKE